MLPRMKRTMNDVHDSGCAVAATAEIIATKWTPLIVHDLSEGPRRFMELEHACPGISPRTLSERLKEPFTRRDPSRTGSSGAGLGLAIASRIIADHKGYIHVEDNTPVGASFVVEIPAG